MFLLYCDDLFPYTFSVFINDYCKTLLNSNGFFHSVCFLYRNVFADLRNIQRCKVYSFKKGIGCQLKEIGRDPDHLLSFITSTKIKLTIACPGLPFRTILFVRIFLPSPSEVLP